MNALASWNNNSGKSAKSLVYDLPKLLKQEDKSACLVDGKKKLYYSSAAYTLFLYIFGHMVLDPNR